MIARSSAEELRERGRDAASRLPIERTPYAGREGVDRAHDDGRSERLAVAGPRARPPGQGLRRGIDGARYALRVRNLTNARIELVPSVDGLDVQSGEDASFSRRGLVINAHETYDFQGYRLDMTNVATFRFGGVGASYAAQMGKPRNIGVIGVAVFEEKEKPTPPPGVNPSRPRAASTMDFMPAPPPPGMGAPPPAARAPAPAGAPAPPGAPRLPGPSPPSRSRSEPPLESGARPRFTRPRSTAPPALLRR